MGPQISLALLCASSRLFSDARLENCSRLRSQKTPDQFNLFSLPSTQLLLQKTKSQRRWQSSWLLSQAVSKLLHPIVHSTAASTCATNKYGTAAMRMRLQYKHGFDIYIYIYIYIYLYLFYLSTEKLSDLSKDVAEPAIKYMNCVTSTEKARTGVISCSCWPKLFTSNLLSRLCHAKVRQ